MKVISAVRRVLTERRKEERGAVLLLTAISMIALLGAGAMGVDIGFSVYGSRVAQSIADTAALDLAQVINAADQQTTEPGVQTVINTALAGVKTDNGSTAVMTATAGLWKNGAWSVPVLGCHATTPPAPNPCNAVKVTASQTVPQPFWGGFASLLGNSQQTTIAYWSPYSCFSIGSYLASINTQSASNTQQTAALNAILSQFGSANVTVLGYQGLANTFVSLNGLITASGGVLTASNILTASLSPATWLSIFKNAVSNETTSGTCSTGATTAQSNALSALTSNLSWSGGANVALCQLVTINGSSCSSASLSTTTLSAGVNVLQTLTTEAELANGSSGFNVSAAFNGLPGVTAAKLILSVIQPAQVAYGPVGTTATTAQLTADLQFTMPLLGGTLDIPLTAASGTATLTTLTCVNNVMQSTKISASTNTATAAITLGGASVATLTVTGASTTLESYSASTVPPTDATMNASPPTNPRQLGTNQPTLSYAGLSALSPVFTLLTSNLPALYGPVLNAAGVSVGGADVADLGSYCDKISLVQ